MYEEQQIDVAGGVLIGVGIYFIIMLAISILLIISMYKIFKKAGMKEWKALIPFYNLVVIIQIAELPVWYIALSFIPFANIYAMFKICIEIAHKFGKSTGFGIASVFFSFICFPILAFGNAQYKGTMLSSNSQNFNENKNIINNTQSEVNGLNIQENIKEQPELLTTTSPASFEINNQLDILESDNLISNVKVIEPEISTNNNSLATSVIEPEVQESIITSSIVEPQVTSTEKLITNKKFCPNCGKQVDQNDVICFMCGHQFLNMKR